MLWVLIRIASPYFVDAHLNRLAKVILISTHNIGFYEELSKLSLNNHQIL